MKQGPGPSCSGSMRTVLGLVPRREGSLDPVHGICNVAALPLFRCLICGLRGIIFALLLQAISTRSGYKKGSSEVHGGFGDIPIPVARFLIETWVPACDIRSPDRQHQQPAPAPVCPRQQQQHQQPHPNRVRSQSQWSRAWWESGLVSDHSSLGDGPTTVHQVGVRAVDRFTSERDRPSSGDDRHNLPYRYLV